MRKHVKDHTAPGIQVEERKEIITLYAILFLSERDNYFDFFSPSTFIVVLGKQKHGGGFVNTVVLEVCVFVCLGENKKE